MSRSGVAVVCQAWYLGELSLDNGKIIGSGEPGSMAHQLVTHQ